MSAYCCEKLCSGPCCEPLRWALDFAAHSSRNAQEFAKQSADSFMALADSRGYAAVRDIHDPAKLAELGAMALRARGFADAAHFDDDFAPTNQFRIRVQDDSEIICVVWRIEGTHKLQCVRCTLPQFRAILAQIMATPPDASSREQCERLIRGES